MNNKFKQEISALLPFVRLALTGLTVILASCGSGTEDGSVSSSSGAVAMNQGPTWNATNQAAFYAADQGSRIMPYQWAKALKMPNGESFLSSLSGSDKYIANPVSPSNPEGLPVGFLVVNSGTGSQQLSMNCAACHTRQIQVDGVNLRIDGGPAISNLYALFQGIDLAVGNTLSNADVFNAFQAAVQVPADTLRTQLTTWYTPYHTLMSTALPSKPWGLGRADAVGLIQNHVSGLDIGPAANSYMISSNIFVSEQAVRYPFLWNSAEQDFTQWAGSGTSGNSTYSLQRNSGEAIGVFGILFPQTNPAISGGVDFLAVNSINYAGMANIQNLVEQIGPPQWPWPVDNGLVFQGRVLYEKNCTSCHGIKPGQPRPGNPNTWATPVQNVQTDSSYYKTFGLATASSGILTGLSVPFTTIVLPASRVLSIDLAGAVNDTALVQLNPNIDLSIKPPARATGSYESRVLQGVWAAAPYLHNGSVPTLAALLTPAAARPVSFQVGPVYDLVNVGLAAV